MHLHHISSTTRLNYVCSCSWCSAIRNANGVFDTDERTVCLLFVRIFSKRHIFRHENRSHWIQQRLRQRNPTTNLGVRGYFQANRSWEALSIGVRQSLFWFRSANGNQTVLLPPGLIWPMRRPLLVLFGRQTKLIGSILKFVYVTISLFGGSGRVFWTTAQQGAKADAISFPTVPNLLGPCQGYTKQIIGQSEAFWCHAGLFWWMYCI